MMKRMLKGSCTDQGLKYVCSGGVRDVAAVLAGSRRLIAAYLNFGTSQLGTPPTIAACYLLVFAGLACDNRFRWHVE